MRKHNDVCQVAWASTCGTGGCGKAPGGPYQPLRPSRCSLETVGGERGVPLLFSLIYDCSLWHASDRYHCGKDRNKARGGRARVFVCASDQPNNLCLWLTDSYCRAAAADIAHKEAPSQLQGRRKMIRVNFDLSVHANNMHQWSHEVRCALIGNIWQSQVKLWLCCHWYCGHKEK